MKKTTLSAQTIKGIIQGYGLTIEWDRIDKQFIIYRPDENFRGYHHLGEVRMLRYDKEALQAIADAELRQALDEFMQKQAELDKKDEIRAIVREEFKRIFREEMTIDVKTEDSYAGSLGNDRGELYDKRHTLEFMLDDELIHSVYLG